MVHELVLLARLDHATPVGPRGKWGGGEVTLEYLKVHLRPWHCGRDRRDTGAWLCPGSPVPSFLCSQQEASLYLIPPNRPCPPTCPCLCPGPPVLPELACDLEDVHHALPPQLLAADAGGDEAASPADARTEGQGGQGKAQWVRAGAEPAEAVMPDPLQSWLGPTCNGPRWGRSGVPPAGLPPPPLALGAGVGVPGRGSSGQART